MKLSIIIPIYNEQATIGELIQQVRQVELAGIEKEIIVVDDGSTDDSPVIIKHEAENNPDLIKVYTSLINLGKGAAIRFGLEHVSGDIVIIQDADLELDPHEYPRLIQPLLENQADVVYGSRFLRKNAKNISLKTRLGNLILTRLTNILYGSQLTDMETSYKVFRPELLAGIKLRCVSFDIEPELTAKFLLSGYKILEVPISYNPRREDEGKKIRWTDGVDALYVLLRYRFFDKPVRHKPVTPSSIQKSSISRLITIIALAGALLANLAISLKISFQDINFIKDNLSLSYEAKMRLKWGSMFDFFNFVREHTLEDSVIMIPPQKEPPWNISGNRPLTSYFLYPRQVINGPDENAEVAIRASLEAHPNVTHLLLTSEQGALWPNIPPETNSEEVEIQTYRPGWGIIKLRQR